MHLKTPRAHFGAPGKDEFGFLQTTTSSEYHSRTSNTPNNETAYHMKNISVNKVGIGETTASEFNRYER